MKQYYKIHQNSTYIPIDERIKNLKDENFRLRDVIKQLVHEVNTANDEIKELQEIIDNLKGELKL